MSTQAVSSLSLWQELQNIRQDRADLQQSGRALTANNLTQAVQSSQTQSPGFVVTITASQGAAGSVPAPSTGSQHNFYQQRRADLQQLGQALTSGDLDAAQKAYDALVALGTDGPLRNGQTFWRPDRAQDFAAIGQALTSGDLAGAGAAFATLASTFGHPGPSPLGPPTPLPPQTQIPPEPVIPPQGIGPTGPPTFAPPATLAVHAPVGFPEIIINVGGGNSSGQAGDVVVNLPPPSANPEDVQINFGRQQSTGGPLTIDLQGKSGDGEAVSINLNGGSNNYQLVLNLFQGASTNVTPQGSLSLQA